MLIMGFLFSNSIPKELRNWLAQSLVHTRKADIDFQASYIAGSLKLRVELAEDSHLYLFLKNTKNETILLNIGFLEKGKHVINVEPRIEDSVLFAELFTSKIPLLNVQKIEEEQEIFNFFIENNEMLRSSWTIVFRENNNATLKIYSDHDESVTVTLDEKKIGNAPIFIAVKPGIHRLILTKGLRKWTMLLYLVDSEERELNLSDHLLEGVCKVELNREITNYLKVDFENTDQNIFHLTKGIHAFELFGKDILSLSENINLKENSKKIILDPKKGVSSLLLKTQPNSMVFIDGTLKGLSDKNGVFLSRGLDQGLVVVKLIKTGFLSEEFPVILKPGINIINKKLSKLVKITVKTNFKPVKLFVDGKYFTTLDKNIQSVDLPKGDHILRFENSLCYTIQKNFNISENSEINLEFQKLPLHIYVVVNFDGKNLRIDLISSERSKVTILLFRKNKQVLKKVRSINRGHNYIEIKNLKEGDYSIKFLSENIKDEIEITVQKDLKFEVKKLLNILSF